MKLTTDSGAPRRPGGRQSDINYPARTPDTAAPLTRSALIDQLTQANASPAPRDLPAPEPTAAAAAGLTPMQALDLANGYELEGRSPPSWRWPMTDLADFQNLPPEVQAIGRRRLVRLSRAGHFPPFVRLAPYGEPLWRLDGADGVEAWLEAKLAPLTPAAGSSPARPAPALIPAFDGEPDDPRGGVTP